MEIQDKKLHRIAITAVIYGDDGKYLITRRSLKEKASPGKWTVPGGQMSIDDYIHEPQTYPNQWYNSLERTLRREVKEEVNLEIEKPEYLLDLTIVRPDGVPVLILSYFAKLKSGEIAYDEDTIGHAWVNLEEAKKYDLIPGIYDELEMVEKILKSRAS